MLAQLSVATHGIKFDSALQGGYQEIFTFGFNKEQEQA
jgi:hypothetical protein